MGVRFACMDAGEGRGQERKLRLQGWSIRASRPRDTRTSLYLVGDEAIQQLFSHRQ